MLKQMIRQCVGEKRATDEKEAVQEGKLVSGVEQ